MTDDDIRLFSSSPLLLFCFLSFFLSFFLSDYSFPFLLFVAFFSPSPLHRTLVNAILISHLTHKHVHSHWYTSNLISSNSVLYHYFPFIYCSLFVFLFYFSPAFRIHVLGNTKCIFKAGGMCIIPTSTPWQHVGSISNIPNHISYY